MAPGQEQKRQQNYNRARRSNRVEPCQNAFLLIQINGMHKPHQHMNARPKNPITRGQSKHKSPLGTVTAGNVSHEIGHKV